MPAVPPVMRTTFSAKTGGEDVELMVCGLRRGWSSKLLYDDYHTIRIVCAGEANERFGRNFGKRTAIGRIRLASAAEMLAGFSAEFRRMGVANHVSSSPSSGQDLPTLINNAPE